MKKNSKFYILYIYKKNDNRYSLTQHDFFTECLKKNLDHKFTRDVKRCIALSIKAS